MPRRQILRLLAPEQCQDPAFERRDGDATDHLRGTREGSGDTGDPVLDGGLPVRFVVEVPREREDTAAGFDSVEGDAEDVADVVMTCLAHTKFTDVLPGPRSPDFPTFGLNASEEHFEHAGTHFGAIGGVVGTVADLVWALSGEEDLHGRLGAHGRGPPSRSGDSSLPLA